jgi:hypothetical protein
MTNPRDYWNTYVEQNGGPIGVATRLSIPYSTIACVCNGTRGIGRRLAIRMATADPMLDAGKLALVHPIENRAA